MINNLMSRVLAPAMLAAALGLAAMVPGKAHANDNLVRVLIDVADVIYHGGQPYYRHGNYGYYDRVVIVRDRHHRPSYYRYVPRHHVYRAPPPRVIYRTVPPRHVVYRQPPPRHVVYHPAPPRHVVYHPAPRPVHGGHRYDRRHDSRHDRRHDRRDDRRHVRWDDGRHDRRDDWRGRGR